MALSNETWRRVLVVVTTTIALAGCSATADNGETGLDGDGPAPLGANFYPGAVSDICAATDARLVELPTPGDGIAETDWAGEVSRIIEEEADALGNVGTISAVRDDHRAFVANTRDQATQWSELSAAITSADGEGIDAARTEILELSRGRIELATELGIGGCRERSL